MKIDLFIPVHNLMALRGLLRLEWFMYSVSKQTLPINKVWIGDSSNKTQFNMLDKIIEDFDFINHVYIHDHQFNKPNLINTCAKKSDADYFIFSDADYLFSKDLIYHASLIASPDKMILKEVKNLHDKSKINKTSINAWHFPDAKPYAPPWNHWACGAFQLHHRSFFEDYGGLDERMIGHEAMDEDYKQRAEKSGLKIHWMDEGEILHQWHPNAKRKGIEAKQQSERNQYLKDHDKTIRRNELT